jgi:hypothetical protein
VRMRGRPSSAFLNAARGVAAVAGAEAGPFGVELCWAALSESAERIANADRNNRFIQALQVPENPVLAPPSPSFVLPSCDSSPSAGICHRAMTTLSDVSHQHGLLVEHRVREWLDAMSRWRT